MKDIKNIFNKMKIKSGKSSLGKNMLLTFIPLIAVALSIVSILNLKLAKKGLNETTDSLMIQLSNTVSNEISIILKDRVTSLSTLAADPSFQKGNTENRIKALKSYEKENNLKRLTISDIKGNAVDMTGLKVSIAEREYFKKAVSGEKYISNPIKSKIDGEMEIFISVPIINDKSEIKGVLTGSYTVEDFSKIATNIKVLNNGGIFILSDNGEMVAHRESDALSEEYSKEHSELHNKIINNPGIHNYNDHGVEKTVVSKKIEGANWIACVYVENSDIFSSLKKMQNSTLLMNFIILIIVAVLILLKTKKIASSIREINDNLRSISNGKFNLNVSEKIINNKTEIGEMGRDLVKTSEDISNMIAMITENAETIEKRSDELEQVSKNLTEITDGISQAINDVAQGTSSQSETLVDIAGKVADFGKNIDIISGEVSQISIKSDDIKEKAESGNYEIDKLTKSIAIFNKNFQSFKADIGNTNKMIQKVNDMTSLITNISEQTNLLALNAAIEAARAGEAGKGFAVVAEEIRNLAEMSKNSAEEIFETVSNIIDNTKNIAVSSEEMSSELKEQGYVVSETIRSFEQILISVENIIPLIKNTTDGFKDINSSKNELVGDIESISAISEEISATAEEISASAEELNSASENVYESSDSLKNLTVEMSSKLNEFDI